MYKCHEIDVTIHIEYQNIENDSNIQEWMYRCWCIHIVCTCVSYRHTWFSFITACTPLLFHISVRSGKIICKRGRQRNRLCETNRNISLPPSSMRFSAFPFHSRRANRSNRWALSVCWSVYRIRMYKERKNRELVGGSMRNGRPSLPLARLSRQSRRVTMNGRYYFIGDQAKSKIEKRTGRDERK